MDYFDNLIENGKQKNCNDISESKILQLSICSD